MDAQTNHMRQDPQEGEFYNSKGGINPHASYGNAIKNTLQGAFLAAAGPTAAIMGTAQAIATKNADMMFLGTILSVSFGGAGGFMGVQAIKEGIREFKYLRQQASLDKAGP